MRSNWNRAETAAPREAGLGLTTGDHFERRRVDEVEKGLALADRFGILHRKQPVVQAHLDGMRMRRRDPVQRRFHAPAVGSISAPRRRIVGAAQLDDLAVLVLHHFVTGDEVGAAQPHLAPRREAEELLRRILPEVVAFDVELA